MAAVPDDNAAACLALTLKANSFSNSFTFDNFHHSYVVMTEISFYP